MRERAAIRLTPRNDHRDEGVPQAIVDEDPTFRALIASLTKQAPQSPNKAALMKELFPEDGKSCTPTSEEAKTVVKEQGNVEALEHPRTHGHGPVCCNCISYVTPGLVCCQCGRSLTCEKSRPAHRGADPALPHAEVWPPHNDGLRASKGPRK